MTPPRTPTRYARTHPRTARSSGLPLRAGRRTAPAPGPAVRSPPRRAGHPTAGVPLQELRPGTSQTRHQRATPTSEPLRKQQRQDQEHGQQHSDHQAHSVLGTHRRCPARTASVKITNASTVTSTKIRSATSGPWLDLDPTPDIRQRGPGTRQAFFTRPIRGAAQNSRYFYAGHRRYSSAQVRLLACFPANPLSLTMQHSHQIYTPDAIVLRKMYGCSAQAVAARRLTEAGY